MQLDQNLFKPGSVGSLLNAGESRFGGGGFQGGFEIPWIVQSQTGMRAAKPLKASTAVGLQQKLRTRVDDTMMEVYLTTPLAPGATTQFDLAYSFNIPEHGGDEKRASCDQRTIDRSIFVHIGSIRLVSFRSLTIPSLFYVKDSRSSPAHSRYRKLATVLQSAGPPGAK